MTLNSVRGTQTYSFSETTLLPKIGQGECLNRKIQNSDKVPLETEGATHNERLFMAQKRQKSGLCQWPTNAWPPLKQGNVPKTEAIITVVSPANFFFLVRSPENWDGIFFSALEAERPGFSMRQFSSVQFGSIFFFLLFFCSLAKWCWLSAELVWFADLPCATSASVSPASACRDEQKVEQKTWKPYNRVVVVSQIYKKK